MTYNSLVNTIKHEYMSMRMEKIIQGLAIAILLASIPTEAGSIRKIVHPDGHVEYTNLTTKQQQIRYTNRSYSSPKKLYRYTNNEGITSFSDKKPNDFKYQTLRFACYACSPNSPIDWHRTPLNLLAYRDYTKKMADKYSVEEALIRAVIHAESGFKVAAKSHAGAVGLMQLMPETANDMGATDRKNAEQNIEGGTRYLAMLLENFSGDVRLATAAYNAGPENVAKYKGVPPYAETQAYVKRVAILKARYTKALD